MVRFHALAILLLFSLTAIAGCAMVRFLSKLIPTRRTILWLGRKMPSMDGHELDLVPILG